MMRTDEQICTLKKDANKHNFAFAETVTYSIYAKNRGPYDSKIKVVDALPAGLIFFSVSDNKSSFHCSESSNIITCKGNRKFAKDEQVIITVEAIVIEEGTIDNTAVISSYNNIPDTILWNNHNTRSIYVGVPGGYESVTIKKNSR